MFDVVLVDFAAFAFQLIQSGLHINRVPERNRIDDQIQASRLIKLVFLMLLADSLLAIKTSRRSSADIAPQWNKKAK